MFDVCKVYNVFNPFYSDCKIIIKVNTPRKKIDDEKIFISIGEYLRFVPQHRELIENSSEMSDLLNVYFELTQEIMDYELLKTSQATYKYLTILLTAHNFTIALRDFKDEGNTASLNNETIEKNYSYQMYKENEGKYDELLTTTYGRRYNNMYSQILAPHYKGGYDYNGKIR